jgi:hypothetical protein
MSKSVSFRKPSYLMYGDESGKTSATAIFRFGGSPDTKPVPLSTNTFTEVGGFPIGGPELIAIQISSSLTVKIVPDKSFEAVANSWSVLQCPPPGPERMFNLQVFVNGEVQIVPFSQVASETSPPMKNLFLDSGAIYNDLDAGSLNVDYIIPGSKVLKTPIVGQGQATGGVFKAEILSFNISSVATPGQWVPAKTIFTSKGLPVLVYGKANAPMLAVFRPNGPVEIAKLVPKQ